MFNKNIVQIQDFQQVKTKTFSYISVCIQRVVLNESVDVEVRFYDIQKKFQDTELVHLTGSDYSNWGNDDNYILNIACQKLGLTLA